MTLLKKYKKLEIAIVLIKNDIITNSGGLGGGGIIDPWGGDTPADGPSIIRRMNPNERPLGVFKRD